MNTRSKKRRISEAVGRGNSGNAPSSSSQARTNAPVEFPSTIFTGFIEMCGDVRFLKLCRLVCQSWNAAAIRALRKYSVVIVREEEVERCEKFKDLLISRSLGPWDWRSPFEKFDVTAISFTESTFKNLILMPNTVITKFTLNINAPTDLDQKELETFLVAKGSQITATRILISANNFTPNIALLSNDRIRLSALKRLLLEDWCYPRCSHTKFLERILSHSNLAEINLIIRDEHIASALLTDEKLQTVVSLSLSFREISTEALNNLGARTLPALKKLTVQVRGGEVSSVHQEKFTLLMENISATIEDVSSLLLDVQTLPVLPELTNMTVSSHCQISEFTPVRFPSLDEVIFYWKSSWTVFGNVVQPNQRVDGVTVCIQGSESEQLYFSETYLLVFLTCLSRQFPNTKALRISIEPFNTSTFRCIYQAFPTLETLVILSQCNFQSISGVPIDIMKDCLERDLSLEDMPRRDSIFDFNALKSLVLGPEVMVTNDMVTYCLSSIPVLKRLLFHWNGDLSPMVIRFGLGHLKEVRVWYNGNFDDAFDQLYTTLPNIHFFKVDD